MVVTFVTFLPALHGAFVWDDVRNLVENERFRGLGWMQLGWMWRTILLGHYIPVTWMTFGLNYVLGGMNPWGYHFGNIALHAVNAGLFFLVARRLLQAGVARANEAAAVEKSTKQRIMLLLGSAFAALVFGVHPLRVESVAWVTERRDVLCGFFVLLVTLAYLTACARGSGDRLHTGWYWVAVVLFALALLSKSIAVGLPVVLLMLDAYPLRRIEMGALGWHTRAWRLVAEKWPFFVLSLVISLVMLLTGRGVLTPLATLGVPERFAVSGYGLMFYLWKAAFPWPLSPLYELHHPVVPLSPGYLLTGSATAALTVAVILAWRHWPGGLTAWGAYVVFLLPVIGVSHNGMQIVADRYTYLSMLGFAVLGGSGFIWLLGAPIRVWVKSAAGVVLVLALVGWALASWRQSKIWLDEETAWRQALSVDPSCSVCPINLGSALTGRPTPSLEQIVEAEQLFRRTLQIDPGRVYAYYSLGVALAMQRRFGEAEEAFNDLHTS